MAWPRRVRLLGDAVEVTLLDVNNFHTFQPLLYQVATAGLDGENVAYAIRGSVRGRRWRPSNVTVRMVRVSSVDVAGRAVVLVDGDRVPYDTLVLASGAVSNDFGVSGVAEHTLPLKHVDDAIALRIHVLSRFEEAAEDPSLVADGVLDIVICGGGPTGVEMAGGLHELYRMVLARDFPQLPVRDARITLVEMGDRLLAPFTPASSESGAAGAGRSRRRRALRRQRRPGRAGAGPPVGRHAAAAPARSCGPRGSRPRASPPPWARR